VVSAPSEGADITVVYGINHLNIKPEHRVISNGSCTTNCAALIVYVLDKRFGIKNGYMTTIHSYTGDQRLIDTAHADLRRARATQLSMIPSSTGAARTIGLVLPHLRGQLEGSAIRVPTANVSLVDLACMLEKPATIESINELMLKFSKEDLNGLLGYSDLPLVSIDFNHTSESSIFDAMGTSVISDNFCRVIAWYDNEFGFSTRMLDVCSHISRFC
jgi:glyceraldehyde 3-phosphate dehydrogenase